NKKVGDAIDLPVKPADAKPDFVNHTFSVVGILNETKTAPDTFAYINLADGQTLLRDSLPVALQSSFDVTQITEGISAYGTRRTSGPSEALGALGFGWVLLRCATRSSRRPTVRPCSASHPPSRSSPSASRPRSAQLQACCPRGAPRGSTRCSRRGGSRWRTFGWSS